MIEEDPINFIEAIHSPNSLKCVDDMKDKVKLMADNGVKYLIKLPEGNKIIGCKWIFKTKKDSKDYIKRYKTCIVFKGFTLKEGIDY